MTKATIALAILISISTSVANADDDAWFLRYGVFYPAEDSGRTPKETGSSISVGWISDTGPGWHAILALHRLTTEGNWKENKYSWGTGYYSERNDFDVAIFPFTITAAYRVPVRNTMTYFGGGGEFTYAQSDGKYRRTARSWEDENANYSVVVGLHVLAGLDFPISKGLAANIDWRYSITNKGHFGVLGGANLSAGLSYTF